LKEVLGEKEKFGIKPDGGNLNLNSVSEKIRYRPEKMDIIISGISQ